jgi:glycosyltransferase involved in cell wall biosynthesis
LISVVAICRNEEKNVRGFLASWSELADEIIILDTGSTDSTRELLNDAAYGNDKLRVLTSNWPGDFSAVRNAAASKACGNWILWADMDDRVHQPSIPVIRALANGKPRVLVFQVASDVGGGNWHRFLQPRMYPARTGVQFEGRIHETIEKSARHFEFEFDVQDEVIIAHLGYADSDLKKQKAVRNMEALMEDDSYFSDPIKLMQIGDALYVLGKYFVGLGYYEEAVRQGGGVYKAVLAEKLCHGYHAVGALEKMHATLLEMDQNSVEYWFWMGQLYLARGARGSALRCFRSAINGTRNGLAMRECNADAIINAAKQAVKKLEDECVPA